MAKIMKTIAIVSFAITILLLLFYNWTENSVLLALVITFAVNTYHFVMRLAVGTAWDTVLHNRVDYQKKWFQVSELEKKIYKKLKVKNWKSKMPTYDETAFDKKIHTWDEIAQAMCQAELVHETIMILSFVPILASVWLGALPVFLITSILAAGFDGMFVVMQRFNRPRIIRMIKK